MKRRICVRSMGLGAAIMLIGLAVGAIVSPPLVAQRNGVFDEIQCRGLQVVDENGNEAIVLTSAEKANVVAVFDKQGKVAIGLASMEEVNTVTVSDKQGEVAIDLSVLTVTEPVNSIGIRDAAGNEAIRMSAVDSSNSNHIGIYDKAENIVWKAP